MKIPFNKFTMIMAVNNIDESKAELIDFEALTAKFAGMMPEEKAEKNKMIADYNGISVDTLISSPNYEKLVDEYQTCVANKIIEEFQVLLDCPPEAAWGLLAYSQGMLN